MENEWIDLTPDNDGVNTTTSEPVRIKYGDVKMELPRLDDSTQLPTTILLAGMTVASKGWDNLNKEEQLNFMAVLLAYICSKYPRFEQELDHKSQDKITDIGRVFAAWAQASKGLDPKA